MSGQNEISKLSGILTALITPFQKGEIDWASLKKQLRQQIDGGVQGIVVCGTTGETPTLSLEERRKIFEFVRSESAGAVTLVMGTGSNSTNETITATKAAKEWGADAALVVVPYYNKPTQAGLVAHFTKVTESVFTVDGGMPVILYNVPSRTITSLEIETIQTLAKVPGIVAIKEATGSLEFGRKITQSTSLLLASGDDASCMKLVGAGSKGVISVISHLIPKEMTTLFRRAQKGEVDAVAAEWEKKYGALNRDLYIEANPIPLKYALYKMGIIASCELRLPMTELDTKYRAVVEQAMKAGGLL
jgi:4-hydroxy-tetrahydrodipicolinate synthase